MKKYRLLSNLYVIGVMAFLYMPIAVLIVFSFNESKSRSVFTGFTLDWYVKLFQNEAIISSLINSLVVAVISAAVATVLGTAAAVGINAMSKIGKSVVLSITNLPIINPEIVTGISLMLLMVWMNFEFGLTTLVFAHITFCVPYVITSVLPKLRQMDKYEVEAAQDLGCSPVQAFFKVVLPEIAPGIFSGFLISMTYSFDDFVISHFCSGPGAQTLPLTIFSMTRKKVSPEINALSTIMFVVIMLVLVINNVVNAKREAARKGGK